MRIGGKQRLGKVGLGEKADDAEDAMRDRRSSGVEPLEPARDPGWQLHQISKKKARIARRRASPFR